MRIWTACRPAGMAALSRQVAGRQLRFGAEVGVSRFQQGRVDLAILQTHRRGDVGLFLAHAADLRSFIGASYLTARSQWLDLTQTRYEYSLDKTMTRRLKSEQNIGQKRKFGS